MAKDISEFTVVGPVAYRGKEDCRDVRCTRMNITRNEDGSVDLGPCMGWHCSYCDEPCSSQGHGCDAATTLLDASRKIIEEGDST